MIRDVFVASDRLSAGRVVALGLLVTIGVVSREEKGHGPVRPAADPKLQRHPGLSPNLVYAYINSNILIEYNMKYWWFK